ncbi:MAG: hypothetical protein IMY82_02250 [Chloroflexi bacterium]|nr:hypothetical protein [Chloroflexota bacterium]
MLGRVVRMRPDKREMLQSFIGQTLWDCRVNICRYYHAPCDLYSLGMIYFCSLLANDEHDEAEICRVVEEVGRKLAAFVSAAGKPELYEIERKLGELLAGNRVLSVPEAVFYRAADRKAGAGDLSEELWSACQKLGFAMTTEIAGFSLCSGGDETASGRGAAPIKKALDRLKDLNLWTEGRLFAPGVLRRELRAVADLEK